MTWCLCLLLLKQVQMHCPFILLWFVDGKTSASKCIERFPKVGIFSNNWHETKSVNTDSTWPVIYSALLIMIVGFGFILKHNQSKVQVNHCWHEEWNKFAIIGNKLINTSLCIIMIRNDFLKLFRPPTLVCVQVCVRLWGRW